MDKTIYYKCEYCGKVFKKLKKPLYKHFDLKHTGESIKLRKI